MSMSIKKSIDPGPVWAESIRELRNQLHLNQTELGYKLNYSAMAISRWERGEREPTDRGYIGLGNLAGDPACWYFWERAGLDYDKLARFIPSLRQRLQTTRFNDFEIVSFRSGSAKLKSAKLQLVAIPLLRSIVAAHGEKGGQEHSLLSGPAETMIATPRDWCPNPQTTSCLRVRGNSMNPLILDGYIVAVDTSQVDHSSLNGQIVIAWQKDKGLTLSRFRSFDHTEILDPENRTYKAITLNVKQRWKILARVLWWIGIAP